MAEPGGSRPDPAAAPPKPLNAPVAAALTKAKANPLPGSIWDVVRQLGQGMLTVVSVGGGEPATSPTSLPGEFTPQAVLALNSPKGPVLAAFTSSNVSSMLPPDAVSAKRVNEQQVPAMEVAKLAGTTTYAGLALDPGTEHGMVIPAQFLNAGLAGGRANAPAKHLLNIASTADEETRRNLLKALAAGPIFTPVEKASAAEGKETKFPLVPLGKNEADPDDTRMAVIFGTSPAEIAAAFPPEQWTPVPVRMHQVVETIRKNTPLDMVVVNPLGPTLQLPVTNVAPSVDPDEPTPEPGPSTEPDGGTREGED
ncbi:MAG: SseB family protein [Promicromonosporaceae bacterium]|nr:SseB family protein [Promicromonosporaceae bacterium]